MAGARVVVRRCPDCGGEVLGREGVDWLVCVRCPLAFDPFNEPPKRIATARPKGEVGEAAVRLPFFVFGVGREGEPRSVWINAFRVIGLQTHGDAGARLTERGYLPAFESAPLGGRLARGPAAALRLLRAREGLGEHDPLEVRSVSLVSLPCRVEENVLREPVSGLVYPRSLVLP